MNYNDKKNYASVSDFLKDNRFVSWRLFRTKDDDAHWATFIGENPHLKDVLNKAARYFDTAVRLNEKSFSPETEYQLYNRIQQRIRKYQRQKQRKITLYALSAAAVAVILTASTFFLTLSRKTTPPKLIAQTEIVGTTLPASDVQLITGENAVTLSENASIAVSAEGQASVTDSLQRKTEINLAKAVTNRLIVPYGKRSQLTLADGTQVWLNSGTELEFPSHFDEKTREIRVRGEVFLDVAKMPDKPFVVHTSGLDVRVFGTAFNLSAYADDASESVVLVEGSVEVNIRNNKPVKLLPNERLAVSDGRMEKHTVNVSEYISWRNGVMEFNKTSMTEVLKKIGRYYNVSFENSPDIVLGEKTCSGKLFLSNNLDSVMITISTLSSTIYKRENNQIYIHKKP